GDLSSFEFVGTAMGGAIFTFAGNASGRPVSLTLSNVTLRRNKAVGGDDNTAGTFMNAGVGGGLVNIATNDFVTPSGGSTTTLGDSAVADNQAVGGQGDIGDTGRTPLAGAAPTL